jgi:integrase
LPILVTKWPAHIAAALCAGFLIQSHQFNIVQERSKFFDVHGVPVPVIVPMQRLLDQYRESRGKPASGPIFATMKKTPTPLSLNNVLNRQILPVLNACVCGKPEDEHEKEDHKYERGVRPEWHGWHAFRRGLATNLHDLGVQDKTIQAILRHANVAVTQNSYIKTLDSQSIAAMRQLEGLVDVKLLSADSGGKF